MKTESCGTKNPLQREGKSQRQRFTEGLSTDYVKVDERTTADLLVWASAFAKQLNYYSATNELDGDWSDFINGDISVRIALIAVTDTDDFKERYAVKEAILRDKLERALPFDTELTAIFEFLLQAAEQIDKWAHQVLEHAQYNLEIRNIIKSRLRRHFRNLVEYAKGSVKTQPNPVLPTDPITPKIVGLSSDWYEQPEGTTLTWAQFLSDTHTPPNVQAYGTGSDAEKAASILERLEFTFRGFYEGQFLIVGMAEDYLKDTLGNWEKHKPHMALFITFLLLFKHAQDHINTFTERHLEFYYEKVLRLSENPATPDKVHVIFTLAKNIFSHALKAGTVLSAGKDLLGKELSYVLAEDVVIGTGQVDTISTIFVDGDDNGRIYMAPVANSGDGQGGDFPKDSNNEWRPFGESQKTVPEDEQTMSLATVGLAIASPVLALSEGQRIITLTLKFDPDTWTAAKTAREKALLKLSAAEQDKNATEFDFAVFLTTKKGWFEINENTFLTIEYVDATASMVIRATLGEEVLPIIGYVEKTHKLGLTTTDPVAQLVMNNARTLCPYGHLRLLRLETIDIAVAVTGMKGLVVQSDIALLSAEKAFQPFGSRPAVGSNFYLGNREAFSKELDNFKVHVQWAKQPADMEAHYTLYQGKFADTNILVNLSILDKRQWHVLGDGKVDAQVQLFSDSATLAPTGTAAIETSKADGITTFHVNKIYVNQVLNQLERQADLEPFTAWTTTIPKGFIRFTLSTQDFGHDQFGRIYARQAIALANGATLNAQSPKALKNLAIAQGLEPITAKGDDYPVPFPNDPYTPEITSISLDYTSRETINLKKLRPVAAEEVYNDRIEKVFHIHAFGAEEVHPYDYDPGTLTSDVATRAINKAIIYLLPQLDGEGLLYIGMAGMDLDENNGLSLLFQVMEDTASPDVDQPDITWAYRSTNSWTAFGLESLGTDDTNGLVTSGIIQFSLPSDASSAHTILMSGLHWIRGSVSRTAALPNVPVVAGVADVITITAQAAKATFQNKDNDPNHLAKALAAETITKLKVKEAEVKAVAQPYASFDGRMVEADDSFYTRVSERLRHKDRSITIWDYETMVLEKFPSVYRVKCLNHTSKEAEVAPGSVYLVVVSNLVNKNAVDPLKPRISVNTLLEIREFLGAKISPFVKLTVENPSYEEIRVDFKVKFMPEIMDTAYYTQLLNEALVQFLTPWANEAGADINFEGRLHSSVILDFVEELKYVDFLVDFKMFHIPDPEKPETALRVEEAVATTPMSILVSAPTHTITLYTTTECKPAEVVKTT